MAHQTYSAWGSGWSSFMYLRAGGDAVSASLPVSSFAALNSLLKLSGVGDIGIERHGCSECVWCCRKTAKYEKVVDFGSLRAKKGREDNWASRDWGERAKADQAGGAGGGGAGGKRPRKETGTSSGLQQR